MAMIAGAAVGLSICCPPAAGETWIGKYASGATRKFGRGVANIATAPLELIRTPTLVGQRDGGIASLTIGMVQGVGAVAVRELAGAIEVATFFIPIPRDFKPILLPEFVYAHGDWMP
jgi:putative exosortase-associated protein (TIGR04073 family)